MVSSCFLLGKLYDRSKKYVCDYLKRAVYSTAYSQMLWHWFRNSSYLSNSAFQFLVSKRELEICIKNSSVLKIWAGSLLTSFYFGIRGCTTSVLTSYGGITNAETLLVKPPDPELKNTLRCVIEVVCLRHHVV